MLANPILLPAWADPFNVVIASVSMGAEIVAALAALRRLGRNRSGFVVPLIAINVTTWIPFLVAIELLIARSGWDRVTTIVGLELLVVLVEAALLRRASSGRVFSSRSRCALLGRREALLVSTLGNLVSIAVSLGIPWLLLASR